MNWNDPYHVIVDDNGVVWVTIPGSDGKPVRGQMQLEDAEALGQKLTIAIRHYKKRTGKF